MKIISIRENPEYKDTAIEYFSSKWSVSRTIYEDSINHSITTNNPLPQWYLLEKDNQIIGSIGLITNDFISRMDLYPWACGLYVEQEHRGNRYGAQLLQRAKEDCAKVGFKRMYLCTDHIGYYEKYGFKYIGQGYHPWDEESRIYGISTSEPVDFIIRREREDDRAEVYTLIQTAFQTAKVKDGDEQDFAAGLRNSNAFIPELSLIAETGNKIIGHILLTKTYVEQPDGSHYEALLVAPLSVLLEYRDRGIGSALMNEAFRMARSLGYKAAFLVGDPNYYRRFGFKQTTLFGIKSKNDIPDQFVQVVELEPDALQNVKGTFNCC